MRVPHDARVCAPSGMQRELAPVLVCVCVCDVSLSPPSLPKVREPVEHFRGKGGELVVLQIEVPAEHTRERGRTRVSEDALGIIAACACHTTRGYVPPAACRESFRPCLCVCVCVCDVSLSPPSLLKVREPVEHRRGEGGDLVVVKLEQEVPAEHTRERGRGGTRVSEDARGSIAACACHTTRGYVPPAACRESLRTTRGYVPPAACRDSLRPCLCVCVSVMCLSPLPPYRRFVSPLNTVAGRAASLLVYKESLLRNTRERGCGRTRVSEDARGSIAACACHTTRGHVPPAACRESSRPCVCVCVCVCDVSLSPPSLLKVREPVEHRRGEGGELVGGQKEVPAEHTRERARGHASQ
jgi:hypothetical protein